MTDVKSRVARGVALLDSKVPDWRSKIDASTLNVANPCCCVLGQLGNWDYTEGRNQVFDEVTPTDVVADHGFVRQRHEDEDGYRELNEAWKEVLS